MELGQVIGRIVAMDCVIKLKDRGFRPDLITGAISMLQQEITTLLSSYTCSQNTLVVELYEEDSYWLNFVKEKKI